MPLKNQKCKNDYQANCIPRASNRKCAPAKIKIKYYCQNCIQTASYEGGTSRKNKSTKAKLLEGVRYGKKKAYREQNKDKYT